MQRGRREEQLEGREEVLLPGEIVREQAVSRCNACAKNTDPDRFAGHCSAQNASETVARAFIGSRHANVVESVATERVCRVDMAHLARQGPWWVREELPAIPLRSQHFAGCRHATTSDKEKNAGTENDKEPATRCPGSESSAVITECRRFPEGRPLETVRLHGQTDARAEPRESSLSSGTDQRSSRLARRSIPSEASGTSEERKGISSARWPLLLCHSVF